MHLLRVPGAVAPIVRRCVRFYQAAVPADGDRLHRDDTPRQFHGLLKNPGKSLAAGNEIMKPKYDKR